MRESIPSTTNFCLLGIFSPGFGPAANPVAI